MRAAVHDYDHIRVTPIAGSLGAEIGGVDLRLLDADIASEIRDAFAEHVCIFFRDQVLTPTDLEAVGSIFGELTERGTEPSSTGSRSVTVLAREAHHSPNERNNGDLWHSDLSFRETPNYVAGLYSKETPPFGGDTMFANMYAAFETLSPTLQNLCEQLVVMHSARGAYGADGSGGKRHQKSIDETFGDSPVADAMRLLLEEETPHPLVVSHPVTRRSLLFISGPMAVRFAGMTDDESEPLIQYLYRHAQRPEFTLRWRWEPNQLAIWDNLACMHFAVQDYSGMRREMYRFEVTGTRPVAARPEAIIT